MDRAISDSEVSSSQQLEENRQETESAALEAVDERMNDVIRIAMQECEEIDAENEVLNQELQNELRSASVCRAALNAAQEFARQRLLEMLDVESQLTSVVADTVNQFSKLQELREQNHAILTADPVYALVQEERLLQQKLQERGIYVYPPTGADADEDHQ